MLIHVTQDGITYPTPLCTNPDPDWQGHFESYRLERQNMCRRYFEITNWNRIGNPLSPSTWEVINFTNETINGDVWNSTHKMFIPGVPGGYNMKVYLNVRISSPLAVLIEPVTVQFGYRVMTGDSAGSWEILGGECNQQRDGVTAVDKTYLYQAMISGADSVNLSNVQRVQWGWQFTGAGDITFIDYFYARFVIEKITDAYNDYQCC